MRHIQLSRLPLVAVALSLTALPPPDIARACKSAAMTVPQGSPGINEIEEQCVPLPCLTPEPPASVPAPDCTPIPGHTPLFVRWPSAYPVPVGTEPNPMLLDVGCFGLVKRSTALPNGNRYFLLTSQGAFGNGFFRATATDASQGTEWSVLGSNAVFKKFSGSWFDAIKCPDLHYFSGSGRVHMYFNAIGEGIGYAYSDDEGRSWRSPAASNPILTAGQNWEANVVTCNLVIENPSVIEYQTTFGGTTYNYLMAYTGGNIVNCANIGLAYSLYPDHGWVKRPEDVLLTDPDNPIIRVGGDGKWDDNSVARPRLVADPICPDVLHIFYSGGAEGSGCPRMARVGHAYSTDRGQTWVKDFVNNPVLDYSANPADWDYGTTTPYCPDFVTSDDGLFLHMYYLGQSPDPQMGQAMMLATVPWSSIPRGTCTPPRSGGGAGKLEQRQSRPHPETGANSLSLAIAPNPAQDAVTLRFALSEGAEISLRIYDVSGRLVAEPARGWHGAGNHDVSLSRGSLAFGRYTAVLESGGERTSRELTWIR
ncbi:MAG: hypothetical protein IT349_00275 [Candidatus Eisenbacteria bacterium]|nr:hypothetical protein [Candidatus Eisenbacteria bacterium]